MSDVDDILGVTPSVQREARSRGGPIPLEGPRKHVRTPRARRLVNSLRADAAAAALDGLPADGETWHCLMDGSYDGFDLVEAVLRHATPATIAELNLATLGFNFTNMQTMLRMFDRGDLRRATMIVSCWYQSDPKEADVCTLLAQELPRRGGWYAAARSHAKLQLIELTDGRCFVIESSANLRTCRSIEQFTITQDRGLLLFHRQWMEDVHERGTRGSDREGEPAPRLGPWPV